MTTLAIITSSVVTDEHRANALDEWATQLVAGFAYHGAEATLAHHYQETPEGFAKGMNDALKDYRVEHSGPLPEWILCVNDDLHMELSCIGELWKHRQKDLVVCPTTDFTSCPEQSAKCPHYESPRRAVFVPAIAWLMPREFVRKAQQVLGNDQLFDESIGRAWFEDNLTARIWATHFDHAPFMVAPTAWAHHEGSRTSNAIPEAERWAARDRFEKRCKELDL